MQGLLDVILPAACIMVALHTEREITVEDIKRRATHMYKTLARPGSHIIRVIPQSYTVD